MINVKLTRGQLLGLMKELPESHWMQIRLMEALAKHEATVQHKDFVQDEETLSVDEILNPKKLTAEDVPLHGFYDTNFHNQEYEKDETTTCDFIVSWVGKCNKSAIVGAKQCLNHYNVKCSMCDSVATNDCGETFQFVCGAALCDKHMDRHDCVRRNRRF